MKLSTLLLAAAAVSALATPALARDQIRIVGSSTVFPFTTAVAETFGRQGKFKTPVVESTGTGGGMRLFCAGVGVEHPDMTNASRRIKKSEVEQCAKNGVTDIIEMKVGFDGIVLAEKKGGAAFEVTREDIWKALAREVPMAGQWVKNPYTNWSQVNPKLPNRKIEVIGPPPTSGTRDSFNELAMEGGCESVPEVKALTDAKEKTKRCMSIREDGAYIEAGENDNLIVQKLQVSADAIGVFGYSFYDQNRDKLQVHKVDGHAPTIDEIAKGSYPISRSMFLYAKTAHIGVIPGVMEFLTEYTNEKAFGNDGYLEEKGLIPSPAAERKTVRESVLKKQKLAL